MKSERTYIILAIAASLLIAAVVWGNRHDQAPATAVTHGNAMDVAGDTLQMTARLSNSHIRADGQEHLTYMLIDVDAASKENYQAPPLDIAVVIDRSSSMVSGGKLEAAKRAARALLRDLRDGDRVSLITYGTYVSTVMPLTTLDSASRARFNQAVDGLSASGGTNISAGLKAAHREFGPVAHNSQVQRIMLLSDGKATAGLGINSSDKPLLDLVRDIRGSGVSVTTMGLGVDFREQLLSAMAETGGGNYYFIPDGARLTETFTHEFKSLKTTVATNASLRLDLEDGVRINRIYGFDHRKAGDRSVTVNLANFWSEENKSMLVEMRVRGKAGAKAIGVAKATLSYLDTASADTFDDATISSHDLALSMAPTMDLAVLDAGVDRKVLVGKERVLTAAVLEQAMDHYEAGRQGEAGRMLNARSRDLERLGKTYDAPELRAESDKVSSTSSRVRTVRPSSDSGKIFLKGNRSEAFKKKRSRKIHTFY